MKIKTTYIDNNLTIGKMPSDGDAKVRELWEKLRDDYTDWVADVRMKEFNTAKPLVAHLYWRRMSTWWLNPLTRKDTEIGNQWFHRLMVLYLFDAYPNSIILDTDDHLLIKAIRKNFSDEFVTFKDAQPANKIEYIKLRWPALVKVNSIVLSLARQIKNRLVLFGFRKKQILRNKGLRSSVWFRSNYPKLWIKDADNNWQDKNLAFVPLDDNKHGEISRYLIYLEQKQGAQSDIFQLRKELNCIRERGQREFAIVDAHLRLKDIIECYFSSFFEWLRFKRWKRSISFRKLFDLSGIDVSDILMQEWEFSYWGDLQFNKLYGVAMARFLTDIGGAHTIVTYGELFVHNRSAYHLCSLIKPKSKFVALQHAMNAKNKMGSYYRETEFSDKYESDHIRFLPSPHMFLTQGSQYSEILSEFFDPKKICIIGSVKYDHYEQIKKNIKQIRRNCNKKLNLNNAKVLLLTPSVNDAKGILDIFSCWEEKDDWKVILSPHPATDANAIKMYQEKLYPWLNIHYESSMRTYELMTVSTLVISGYSTTAIEASFFGVQSVRFAGLGTFPLFEYENNIPVFYDGQSFIEWFEEKNWENNKYNASKKDADKMVSKYFYKIDGKSSNRLWNFLNTQSDLPHNQN